MLQLPTWLRVALLATAGMNLFGALAFLPGVRFGREMIGLPEPHPFYSLGLAEFIFLFGVCYAWCGIRGRAPRLFLALGAAGKLLFFFTAVALWLSGSLPLAAPLNVIGDLVFGALFLLGLYQTRATFENGYL